MWSSVLLHYMIYFIRYYEVIILKIKEFGRTLAVNYAHKWAYKRNPKYYNFDPVGGDCTSFASQCIYAGCNTMNYDIIKGWYYISGNNKSPSWSGVEFLHKFLINNKSVGPYGTLVDSATKLLPGDIVQLSFANNIYSHSLVVVSTEANNNLTKTLVATHTFDSDYRPISSYGFEKIRFIHIQGYRTWE